MRVGPLKLRVPKGQCECGAVLDAATPMRHDRSPAPGDITICLFCQRALQYGDDLKPKAMSEEQFRALPADVQLEVRQIARALELARAMKR